MKNMFFNIISSVLFIAILGLYLFVLIIINFSDINKYLWLNLLSVLVLVAVIVLSVMWILPYKKNFITYWKKTIFLTCVISTAMIITLLMYISSLLFISNFDKDRWLDCPELRTYMISDLEDEYSIKGMHKVDLVKLLGEPTLKVTENCYEYYVSSGLIDSYFYRINFENDIVVTTVIAEH